MIRLLLLVAIAATAWYLYRRLGTPSRPDGAGTAPPPPQAAMLRCAECGVHAPESAGVRYQTLFFCSPAHMNDYVGKHGKP